VRQLKTLNQICLLAILAGFFVSAPLFAYTSLSESYSTTDSLTAGSIVSLKSNSTDEVIASSNASVDNMLGVVISSGSSLLNVSSGKSGQVQVATSGTLPVLVSDINGKVHRGDHITASPVKGIGMRATSNVRVIGVTQGDMSTGEKQTYKDNSGQTKTMTLSQVPVQVNVAYYFKQPDKTVVPAAIQNIADSLAGKEVGTVPILISGAIFLIMLIVVASLVYGMIHSSIISVGRNPLSQSAIYRDLVQLSGLVLVILGAGLVVIYLVLTKL
jgi:hypothetical protein